ncbi:MAG: amidohydrolase family protein [Marinicaulis sp.]|nr:amidohydrolase family protein [Marinicaulis sp.]NNE39663.1 amidohydrolase family protein [Marinicaulis sp.]
MSMRKISLLITGAVALASGAVASAQTTAIMDGRVITVSGDVIEGGDVIISNGRITQVGADLSAPSGATVIDATGKVVTPGIIAPYSTIGLEEIGLDAEANDASPAREIGFPLGAALDAIDAYNPSSILIPINRAGGVTRALSTPEAGDSIFGGQAALIDLSGDVDSVMQPRVAQVAMLGFSGAARAGDTRMGAWAFIREYFDEARSYASNPNDYVRRSRDPRFSLSDLKALGPVVSGAQTVIISANSANDIRNVIRLKNRYRLKVVIVGGSEAWRVAEDLRNADIPVILDPLFNLPAQFEDLDATFANAGRLHDAGVTIGLYNPQGFAAHNLRTLTQQAGNAVANGLSYEGAMAALTLGPATMLGVDAQLGSIEAGKIADVVVWDGDPLEVTTQPEAVFINGVAQSLENRQTMLRDRYRDLSRGDLPHAYRGATK